MLQLFESDQNLLKMPMSGSSTYVFLYKPIKLSTHSSTFSIDLHTPIVKKCLTTNIIIIFRHLLCITPGVQYTLNTGILFKNRDSIL